MIEVAIVGAGDLGREIYYSILHNQKLKGTYRVIGFLDQDPNKANTVLEDLNIYSFDSVQDFVKRNVFFIIGIGHAKYSKKVYRELTDLGVKNWLSVVHPTAYISPNSTIGKGVYIGANTTLSINAHVNDHTIINQNCSIGHDVVIGNHSIISPGCILSGRVEVGNEVFMGSGVVVIPTIEVGSNVIIGANTLVMKNIPSNYQVMSAVRIVNMPIE